MIARGAGHSAAPCDAEDSARVGETDGSEPVLEAQHLPQPQRTTASRSHSGTVLIAATVLVVVVAAIIVRFGFVQQVSGDYRSFLSPWYDQLAQQGFAGLSGDFSNYNPPYLYLILLATHLPLPKIVAIKLISMVFDLVLAGFAALLVRERFPRPVFPLVCFTVVLFAPTVVVNSAWWGQCDSIYAAFCLGSLYFLLRQKPWWAAIFFGLALSFKLQAIFFLPVLIIVLVLNRQRMAGKRPLLALLAVPATFAVLLVPAALAGRDWGSLVMVYPDQVSTGGTGGIGGGGGGGGGRAGFGQSAAGSSLTQNAPTFYQWLGSGASTGWKYVGLLAAAGVVVGVAVIALLRRRSLNAPEIIVLATTIVLSVPFFLPQMHERYFYLADVLTIVLAFYVRRYWVVAAVVSACSLLSYAPFLWQHTVVALPLLAFAEFLAVIATMLVFVNVVGRNGDQSWLRSSVRRPAALQHRADSGAR